MLKLVPKLKTNKSLKLLIVNMKANSSILTRWKGCQKQAIMPYFHCGPSS